MDHKSFSFKITNLDFTGRTVEGYANVFKNKDLTGDIVWPGAFAKTLAERGGKIRFLWQHDTAEPIGRILEMQEDNHGLYMKAVVSDTSRGRDALALLHDGAVDSFSIGYDAIEGGTDFSKDPMTGETVRNLREIRLWEVSLVTIPANELANVTALKEADVEVETKAEPEPEPEPLPVEMEVKAGRRVRGDKIELVRQLRDLADAFSKWAEYDDEKPQPEPDEGDGCTDDERRRNKDGAGTEPLDVPPSTPIDLLTLIEIEEQQLSMIN